MVFLKGIKAMLPITAGVIPFGLVMGTVASNAKLDIVQTMAMNVFVFAGAAQLAAVDLMTQNASSVIIILTGLVINFRFMLYSASLATTFKESKSSTKALAAYSITDQTFATLIANESELNGNVQRIQFYFGSALCMILAWQSAVLLGFIFGNFAPASISLDYAVPLSFVALVLPSIKNKNYIYVGILAALLSIVLKPLPFNLGLLASGLLAIGFGAFLTRKKPHAN